MTETVKVLITGDFYSGGRINDLILKSDNKDIFNDFLPIIKESDIAITNLEAPLTKETKAIPKTGPSIKAPPETAKALKFAGFNLVTLANNHILDFGEQGLMDTLKEVEKKGIHYLGAGKNLNDAQKTLYKDVKGYKLSFLNFAENEWATTNGKEAGANPVNPVANYYAIKEAKEKADFVFVIVHGGHEMYSLPSPRMKETYRFFVDAGASAVIGHHTHVISGCEVYKNRPIFYSLGNFVFDSPGKKDPRWNKGIAVQFFLSGENLAYEIIPYSQNTIKSGVQLLVGDEKKAIEDEVKRLGEIIEDDVKLMEAFEKYCSDVGRIYDYFIEPHSNRYLYFLQRKGLLPSFLSKRKRILYKNLIRCEAHRDVLLKIVSK